MRLLIREAGQIVAGGQALIRYLPLGSAIGYIPKGPLFAKDDRELIHVSLEGFEQLARNYRIRHLTVQPSNEGGLVVPLLEESGYRESPVAVAPVATVQIDLSQELDSILLGMRKNHRRYIRHGLRQGMVARLGEESDLDAFHRLLQATSQRQGFRVYPIDHFTELWRLFHPTGHAQLFLVEYRGELVSGQLVMGFRDRVVAKNSGWTGHYGSLGPNYVMDWAALTWAKDQGYRYYDLEGIDISAAQAVRRGTPLPEHLLKTHSFYKLGFGGEAVLFPPAYVLIVNPMLRWFYWNIFLKLFTTRLAGGIAGRLRTRSR